MTNLCHDYPEYAAPAGRPELTRKLIFAAAQDAGNRAMRAGGRTVWSTSDFAVAVTEFERLNAIREAAS